MADDDDLIEDDDADGEWSSGEDDATLRARLRAKYPDYFGSASDLDRMLQIEREDKPAERAAPEAETQNFMFEAQQLMADRQRAGDESRATAAATEETINTLTGVLREVGKQEQWSENVLRTALDFMAQVPNVPESVTKAHAFKTPDDLEPEHARYFHALANLAAERNLTQTDLEQILASYKRLKTAATAVENREAREGLKQEISDDAKNLKARDMTHDVMSKEWGAEYDTNVAAINRLLDNMPESRRNYYETPNLNGSLPLNDPEILRRLAQEARAIVPASVAKAMRETGASERAVIEEMMKRHNSPYFKGADSEQVQLRYRDLIRQNAPSEKPLPFTTGAINDEIAEIEQKMRTNRRAYMKDDALQRRYRELLDRRGSM